MPTSGATASQSPNTKATCTPRTQLNRSGPSAIAVRKLSRLRVNPRMRRLPITAFGEQLVSDCEYAICHVLLGRGRSLTAFQLLLRHREGEQRAAVGRPEHLGQEPLGPATPAARRDDVLPSVDGVGRRVAVVAAAALELPQQLSAVGVPRVELPSGLPAEHEVAARGQQRRAHAQVVGPAPPLLSGARIVGAHVPALVLAVHSDAGTPVRDALLELPAPPRG